MALKDDRVEQCLSGSCGSEFQMWGPKQEKVAKAMSLVFVLLDFQQSGVRTRAQCTRRSVDLQQLRKASRTRTTYRTEIHIGI